MKLLVVFLIFISPSVWGQGDYTFTHPDCKIRIQKKSKANVAVYSLYQNKLTEHGFESSLLVENKKLFAGELYGLLEIHRPHDEFWRSCAVRMWVKKAKGNVIKKSDETLYTRQVKAEYPRLTPAGNERCERALKDVFTHIPHCKRPGK